MWSISILIHELKELSSKSVAISIRNIPDPSYLNQQLSQSAAILFSSHLNHQSYSSKTIPMSSQLKDLSKLLSQKIHFQNCSLKNDENCSMKKIYLKFISQNCCLKKYIIKIAS